ncbi:uncharacterized protein LOC111629578 [Centruroides sculpturatus]|uniref:uncharacterized protein LOC111629578 n=1 Tax=Centruroides sculpturatus TaxID=218467 RepID=UPI000C6E987F|nr:uncharacterized protein LOC111629578 [Centruroides sculpturatus]
MDDSKLQTRGTRTPIVYMDEEEDQTTDQEMEQTTEEIETTLLSEAKDMLSTVMELCPEHTNTNVKQKERCKIRECVANMFGYLHEMFAIVKETRRQMARVENNKSQQAPLQTTQNTTYSDILKRTIKPSNTTRNIQKSLDQKLNQEGTGGSHAVLIYPKDQTGEEEQINMDKVTEVLKSKIEPHKLKIKIKTVRKVKDNGVCIRVGDRDQSISLEKAIKEIKELDDKINCKRSEGKKPRVILLNVPQSIQEDDIPTYIYKQNDIWGDLKEETFRNQCTISTILNRGRRTENCRHVVLSVAPQIRNTFIKEKHISINWATIKVDDYIPITRCYRCCGTGHIAKDCDQEQHCSHCGENHKYSECDRLKKPPCCVNCHRNNKDAPNSKKQPTNHGALHPMCPITKRLKEAAIKRTDYGL